MEKPIATYQRLREKLYADQPITQDDVDAAKDAVTRLQSTNAMTLYTQLKRKLTEQEQ